MTTNMDDKELIAALRGRRGFDVCQEAASRLEALTTPKPEAVDYEAIGRAEADFDEVGAGADITQPPTPASGEQMEVVADEMLGERDILLSGLRVDGDPDNELRLDRLSIILAKKDAAIEAAEALNTTLSEALTRIVEGNLGPEPWQANYDRIKQVASEALAALPAKQGGQS